MYTSPKFPSLVDAVLAKQELNPYVFKIAKKTYSDPEKPKVKKVYKPRETPKTHCEFCKRQLKFELHKSNCPTLGK